MQEDISAYRYDIDYCRAMLAAPGITTQEIRSLHVRLLDCSHHVRHCQHRIELIDAQMRLGLNLNGATANGGGLRGSQHYQQLLHGQQQQHHHQRGSNGTPAPGASSKRKRQRLAETPVPGAGPGAEEDEGGAPTAAATPNAAAEGDSIDVATTNGVGGSTSVQRLGFWKCRLCTAQKYLNAGPNRVPSEPGKWPLKDISKMLNHYLDMHTEHAPDERCRELGDALAQNCKSVPHHTNSHSHSPAFFPTGSNIYLPIYLVAGR